MKEKGLKYFFFISSALLLLLMLIMSREAGISCDEVLHYKQSVAVYNYFTTHGADKSALDTPVTNLKYYPQAYDNIVTFLGKWLNIEDVYSFRNIMSAIVGWAVILLTALFAVWLAGYGAGIFVVLLFAISPTFIGHSLNNLKDIPFALGYISGTYFILKFFGSKKKISVPVTLLLTLSIAFTMSIRAGGLIIVCYLLFFFFVYYFIKYSTERTIDFREICTKLLVVFAVTIIAWFLSILLWPYALQGPVKNVIGSYRIMAHYPLTFMQIFEGKVEWSDYMPWYYLPKSMIITIPLLVLAGIVVFISYSGKIFTGSKIIQYSFILFTVLFPVGFVAYENSNLYSSWRQFLFIYPALILLASVGFHTLFKYLKIVWLRWFAIVVLAILSIHPLKFMILNHPYYYLYYNQLVGGLKGAYTSYETDYYYVSQTEASEWLINYLKGKNINGRLNVSATYEVNWQFREYPEIKTSYIRFEERSLSDWDYAIVVNRYISPFQLRNDFFPPENAIHVIYADKVPICAILERKSKDDYFGYQALKEGRNKDAITFYKKVLNNDDRDEMIFYNFAAALYNDGQYQGADSVLKRGLEINPDFEPILMYLGNIARSKNNRDQAIRYYEKVIKADRKYFEAYVALADMLDENDLMHSRSLLRSCLRINPRYKPAIYALADTYRKSNPDIAEKYDKLANSIK